MKIFVNIKYYRLVKDKLFLIKNIKKYKLSSITPTKILPLNNSMNVVIVAVQNY